MERPFPAYKGKEPFVFVCYAHEDSTVIYPELTWLREQGINLWYDEGISVDKKQEAIGDSLLGASQIVFYISVHSLQSDHCNREINLALDEGKDVLPVYLEDVELSSELNVGLSRVQALYRDQDPSYRQLLLNALAHTEGTSQTVTSPVKRKFRWWYYVGGGLVLAILLGAVWINILYP